jgi:hypothetical protein
MEPARTAGALLGALTAVGTALAPGAAADGHVAAVATGDDRLPWELRDQAQELPVRPAVHHGVVCRNGGKPTVRRTGDGTEIWSRTTRDGYRVPAERGPAGVHGDSVHAHGGMFPERLRLRDGSGVRSARRDGADGDPVPVQGSGVWTIDDSCRTVVNAVDGENGRPGRPCGLPEAAPPASPPPATGPTPASATRCARCRSSDPRAAAQSGGFRSAQPCRAAERPANAPSADGRKPFAGYAYSVDRMRKTAREARPGHDAAAHARSRSKAASESTANGSSSAERRPCAQGPDGASRKNSPSSRSPAPPRPHLSGADSRGISPSQYDAGFSSYRCRSPGTGRTRRGVPAPAAPSRRRPHAVRPSLSLP